MSVLDLFVDCSYFLNPWMFHDDLGNMLCLFLCFLPGKTYKRPQRVFEPPKSHSDILAKISKVREGGSGILIFEDSGHKVGVYM